MVEEGGRFVTLSTIHRARSCSCNVEIHPVVVYIEVAAGSRRRVEVYSFDPTGANPPVQVGFCHTK